MLLSHHKGHTEEALKSSNMSTEAAKQVAIGCTANDLCEFTNEGQMFITSKDVAYRTFGTRAAIFGSIAIYQSHFGDLASMHAMANACGDSPQRTKNEVMAWFQFLNGLALGTISIDPNAKIGSDNVPISSMFANHNIEYDQILDTEDSFEIKNRALGMMCHLIQDAYTYSHCERGADNEIRKFYCYQPQDKQKHKDGDHVISGYEEVLQKQCKICVEIIGRGIEYDCSQILHLSHDAKNSDGGIFV